MKALTPIWGVRSLFFLKSTLSVVHQPQKKNRKKNLLFQANTSSFSSVLRSLRWLTPVDHLERRGSEPHSDVSGPSLASIIFHTSRSPKRNFRKHSSNWRNLKTLNSFSFSSGRKTFNNVISLKEFSAYTNPKREVACCVY